MRVGRGSPWPDASGPDSHSIEALCHASQPVTITDIRYMKVFFSDKPGAHERHLQRKYRNPLFVGHADVTQAAANDARKRDEEEVRQFQSDLHDVLQEAGGLPASVESDVLLALKEKLDMLYERSAGLAGDQRPARQSLQRLIGVMMKAIRHGAAQDPHALGELDQEDAARAMHHDLLETALIAHLLRPDSPIGEDELVPTLLSEDEAAVAAALALFEPAQRAELVARARDLLASVEADGVILPAARQRLRLMERSDA